MSVSFTRDRHEWLKCNRCGKAFWGHITLDGPPHEGAPTGICHGCQQWDRWAKIEKAGDLARDRR